MTSRKVRATWDAIASAARTRCECFHPRGLVAPCACACHAPQTART